MSKNLIQNLFNSFVIIFIVTILICIFFIPFFENNLEIINGSSSSLINKSYVITSNELYWPLPGYTNISSYFGYRNIPTAGATSFHGGIDIPAPPGTNIISAISGKVTFTGFMGSGGCTVVVSGNNYTSIFHHVSPNFLVQKGDYVTVGQIIAQVGPKNVYGFPNNIYKDSNRKSNKWFNNWSSFTFYIKKRQCFN